MYFHFALRSKRKYESFTEPTAEALREKRSAATTCTMEMLLVGFAELALVLVVAGVKFMLERLAKKYRLGPVF